MKINILIFAVIIGVGLTITFWLDQQAVQNTEFETLPNIELNLLNGETAQLGDFTDKPIIVHFWATWCAPCIIEYPELMEMAHKNQNGINVITVAVQDSSENIDNFLKKNKIKIPPNVTQAIDKNWEIAKTVFGTTRLPESFLISPSQEIIKRHNGAVENWAQTPWIKEFNDLQPDNTVDNK